MEINQRRERSGIRRSHSHDYYRPGNYMITLTSLGRLPVFGSLIDTPPASPYVELSLFGVRVAGYEARVITKVYPMVRLRNLKVMPDHLHIILQVTEQMPEGKHLGNAVNGFKIGCRNAYRELFGCKFNVFERGYNDRILYRYDQLGAWHRYLEDNPRRLAVKRRHPDLFKVRNRVHVNGLDCDAVGNMFLLDVPDKMEVIVHRADTDGDFARKKREWLAFGEGGGVLVSASVAPREKEVMREAMNRGYSIILVRDKGMNHFYKPSGEAFDACAAGQLLQISPFPENLGVRKITRAECLFLNDFATGLAAGH